MALGTVTEIKKGVMGDLKYAILDVAISGSYTTGGELFGVAQVPGFSREIFQVHTDAAASGKVAVYDRANGKLKSFTGSAETTAATNLSGAAEIVRVTVFGK